MTGDAPGRRQAALSSLILTAAFACSLGAFSALADPGPWLGQTLLALTGTAVVVTGVRMVSTSAWLPTLVGLLVSGYGIVIGFAGGSFPLLPDATSPDRLRTMVDHAVLAIQKSTVPMTVPDSVALLIVTAAVVLFLCADLLAVGCDVPALSGFALATMWVPAAVLGFPGRTLALAGTGLAYLLLLVIGAPAAPGRSGRWRIAYGALGIGIAAAVVAVSLAVAPLTARLSVWAWAGPADSGTESAGPMRLSDDLDLRDDLGPRSDQVVLSYQVTELSTPGPDQPRASAAMAGPLRIFTLRDFDGSSWSRDPFNSAGDGIDQTLLISDSDLFGTTPDPAQGRLLHLDVTVGELRESRLPVTVFPRTVEAEGSWVYDAARDEVIGDSLRTGDQYAMVAQVPELTADSLRATDGAQYPEAVQEYLAVPGTSHEQDLRDLAAELTAEAGTSFDRALALQSFFRDTTQFRYDTSVAEGVSDDAVWDFLQSRHGYCVQYATAMTVLARALGIPTRLGVGFLPGSATGDGVYQVTGADAHAWPELYFTGVGWVRFEPTPAVQTGAPPSWTDPTTADGPQDAAVTAPTPSASTTAATPGPSAGTTTQGTSAADRTSPAALGILTAALVLLASTVVALVALRRRRTAGALSPELAWARLRNRLAKVGVTWSDATTPRAAGDRIRAELDRVRGRPLGHRAQQALDALVAAVEAERYTPAPPPTDPEQLREWVEAVTADLRGRPQERIAGPRESGDGTPAHPGGGTPTSRASAP